MSDRSPEEQEVIQQMAWSPPSPDFNIMEADTMMRQKKTETNFFLTNHRSAMRRTEAVLKAKDGRAKL